MRVLREYAELLSIPECRDLYEQTQNRRGILLVGLGRDTEALPLLKEAVSFKTLRDDERQKTYLCLGFCYSGLGKFDLAKQEFLTAIDFGLKNGTEVEARCHVGAIYFCDGALAQAKLHFERALQEYQHGYKNTSLKYIYEQLSRVCHYLGEAENAKKYRQLERQTSE